MQFLSRMNKVAQEKPMQLNVLIKKDAGTVFAIY